MICRAITRAGTRCRASAMIGEDFCPMHHPARKDIVQEARRRGAAATKARRQEKFPDFSDLSMPQTLADVAVWHGRVSEALVRGELDPRRGHEITFCLRALKETLEATEHGEKADRLLEAVAALKKAAKK